MVKYPIYAQQNDTIGKIRFHSASAVWIFMYNCYLSVKFELLESELCDMPFTFSIVNQNCCKKRTLWAIGILPLQAETLRTKQILDKRNLKLRKVILFWKLTKRQLRKNIACSYVLCPVCVLPSSLQAISGKGSNCKIVVKSAQESTSKKN